MVMMMAVPASASFRMVMMMVMFMLIVIMFTDGRTVGHIIIVIIVMVVVMVVMFFLFVFIMMFFEFCNPCCRTCYLVEVEHVGVDDAVKSYVTIVALDDFSFGLYGTYDLADASELFGCDVCCLIEQYDITEFYLLDDKILDVVFVKVLIHQFIAATEFVLHTKGIYYGYDAIEFGYAVLDVLSSHSRNGTDGLCDGCRFADTAGFNYDIVEAVLGDDVGKLLNKVHL